MEIFSLTGDFCKYLNRYDSKVMINWSEKERRPFIGVVFTVNEFCYYAPLTSPKPKHLTMRDAVDFIKIKNGELGAINLNNMIPVIPAYLKKVDISESTNDGPSERAYKKLLREQQVWCSRNSNMITSKAARLYKIVTSSNVEQNSRLKDRCCDFLLLESRCKEYELTEGKKPKKTALLSS